MNSFIYGLYDSITLDSEVAVVLIDGVRDFSTLN